MTHSGTRLALVVALLTVATFVTTSSVAASQPLAPLAPPDTVGPSEPPPEWTEPPSVTADAFLLVAADTGQVLAAKRAGTPRLVASTVKVLTAISALRRLDLSAVVTAGPEVADLPPLSATVGLTPGERWSVEDLLEGLVARSGNDAARAMAVAAAGSIEQFVNVMREDAATLGLEDVELHTPTGLEDRNRLSAEHLALLTRFALRDPLFRAVSARPVVTLPDLGQIGSRNELLAAYRGAYGVKTGYTSAAGRCLIAAARRDGRDLVVVVLGSDGPTDHFRDAERLLDFGFDRFEGVAPQPVRLKLPGEWLRLDPTVTEVLVPAGGNAMQQRAEPPVHAAGRGQLRMTWGGASLADVELLSGREPDRVTTFAGWLGDRTYTAMRAATTGGLWPSAAGASAADDGGGQR